MAERIKGIETNQISSSSIEERYAECVKRIESLEKELEKKNRDLTLKTASIAQAQNNLAGIINTVGDALFIVADHDTVILSNKAASVLLGYSGDELIGIGIGAIISEDIVRDIRHKLVEESKIQIHEIVLQKKDGTHITVSLSCAVLPSNQQASGNIIIVLHDLTVRKTLEAQLLQAEKLESIGRLSSGIAHEINTPMQFIGDNTRFLKDSFAELMAILGGAAAATDKNEDTAYLLNEIPLAISQTLEGIQKVSAIVGAMKDFSRPGSAELQSVDINKQLQGAALITTNEWRSSSTLELLLEPDLPSLTGYPGELNQVWLNLIINAAHAIEDRLKLFPENQSPGKIVIKTSSSARELVVSISDNGCGIAESIQAKIFDPFFTTKAVGRGSGQGLTLVRSIVRGKHHGTIDVQSAEGQGSTFTIRLSRKHV
jgi:two-component system NtrC family sensor kinase